MQANNNLETRVTQIERVGMPLASISDDGNGLAL
jgi:hypothetical protein